MKTFMGKLFAYLGALVVALTAAPDLSAQQGGKPVVVVSLSSLDEMFGDIASMAELAGQGDFGRIAVGMGGIYTGGIDRTRPAGVVVSLEGMEPRVTAFVPVTNLKQLLATHAETIGKPRDVGNGVLEIGSDRPQPIYVKEQEGWAFVGQAATQLQNLPKDPAALLGNLPKQYDVAVQVNFGNLPAELRDLAVSQMRQGFEAAMAAQAGNLNGEERKQAEKVGAAFLQNIITVVEEADQFTIGFGIDGKAKSAAFEVSMTAKAGTSLAKAMSGYGKTPSSLHGFVLPGAAVTMIGATPIAASDAESGKALINVARPAAMQAIDNDAGLPNAQARDTAKEIVNTLLDVAVATLDKGKADLAGSLKLGSKSLTLVGGVGVAGGDKVEAALKKLLTLVPPGGGGPDVKFNTGTHAGVNLHSVGVPLPPNERPLRDLFGEKLEIILGTAKDGLYLALGNGGEKTLREALDVSAQNKTKPAPATELQVALAPIVKFASSIETGQPVPPEAVSAAEKVAGKDHVKLDVRSIERGFAYRLEVEQGVVQFVGELVKAAQQGGQLR